MKPSMRGHLQQVRLPDEEVHVWFVPVNEAEAGAEGAAPGLERYRQILSAEERARHARFARPEVRHRFLVSHALARLTLSRCAGVDPAAWTFRTGAHGRPEIAAPAAHADLRFSLSHTRGLAACAVARAREVGVDVEALDRPSPGRDVAARCFSPLEIDDLQRVPQARRHEVFLQYWTLKEAYVKARGLGLTLPLDRFSFHLNGQDPPSISIAPGLEDEAGAWQFAQYRPAPGYVMAVAVRRHAGRGAVIRVRKAPLPA